jgi:hypothetical protein
MRAFPNSTTSVPAEKSVTIIESYLVQMGADSVLKRYEMLASVRVPVAVSFQIKRGTNVLPFTLPADHAATLDAMKRWGKCPKAYLNSAHANRVAWKNLVEWVRSQMVFIYTGGGAVEEVFLPYLAIGDKTLYRRVLALPQGVAGISNKLGYGGPA